MPARPSREASAEPVAPHPTITTRAWVSLCCPSAPIPGNNTCREYRSSSSKEVTSFYHANLYYRFRSICSRIQHCRIRVHRTSEPPKSALRNRFASKGSIAHNCRRIGVHGCSYGGGISPWREKLATNRTGRRPNSRKPTPERDSGTCSGCNSFVSGAHGGKHRFYQLSQMIDD